MRDFFTKSNKSAGYPRVREMRGCGVCARKDGNWLLEGELSLVAKCCVYFWIIYVCNFLFIIHLQLAYCTKYIHRPAKLLLQYVARHPRPDQMDLHTRMRMVHEIYTLHAKKRYGFTYGHYGLVSMFAFTKVHW